MTPKIKIIGYHLLLWIFDRDRLLSFLNSKGIESRSAF